MCLCSFERQSRRVGVGELNEREKVGVFRESSAALHLLPNRC